MDILTIASQKGGAGKRTLSSHLAVEDEYQRGTCGRDGITFIRNGVNTEGVGKMATRKTAPLDGSLIARKGAAVPAQPATVASAAPPTAEMSRAEPIALTVKVDRELYFQLKRRGMRFKPRKSNQEVIVEAIKTYLSQKEGSPSC